MGNPWLVSRKVVKACEEAGARIPRRERRDASLAAEGVHFGKDLGGFGLQRVALLGEVVFGVFAGLVLKVQVAEVVVDDLFALAEVIEAGSFRPRLQASAAARRCRRSRREAEARGR